MRKEYDTAFNKEIQNILNELYYKSLDMGETKIKRAVVETEKRYIDFLEENCIIKRTTSEDNIGKWGIQLERKGFEVFEKYGNWCGYKKKIIDKDKNVENAKRVAARFWWLPIAISSLALFVALLSYLKK